MTNPISAIKIAGNGAESSIPTPTNGDFSLYFHIPFCTKKCDYCHFFVLPDREDLKDSLDKGFDLEHEVILPSISGRKLTSLYFGGGTPSLFGPERIKKLISRYPGAEEITLEFNPEMVTPELTQGYKEAGVNRVSLGIQSLSDPLLVRLGRTHNSHGALKALEILFKAGLANVSVDLMYDLPYQTLSQWEYTLDKILELPITHISLYNLTIEPHTVFFKYKDSLSSHIPDPETSLRMYEMAQEKCQKSGLLQYEISAFAKPDHYSRHNTGYWTGREFYGLGPSAFSYWDKKRFRNVAHLGKYLKKLEAGESPQDFQEELNPESRIRELAAIELRLMQGIIIPPLLKKDFHSLEKNGFVKIAGERAQLTQKGILFYDTVAEELV